MAGRRSNGSRPSLPSPDDHRVQIPNHTKDPVWSLRPWPVVLTIDNRDIEIPALPAADWLAILMKEELDLTDIIFDLVPDGLSLFADESLALDNLYEALLVVIETVTARHWWIAIRLVAVVAANWNTVGSEMMLMGIRAEEVSISAWLDLALVVTLGLMDKNRTTAFIMQLEKAPEGVETPAEELEMSRDQFMSMMM